MKVQNNEIGEFWRESSAVASANQRFKEIKWTLTESLYSTFRDNIVRIDSCFSSFLDFLSISYKSICICAALTETTNGIIFKSI